eukprot:3624663-Pyramimonas_sp.AAC.1
MPRALPRDVHGASEHRTSFIDRSPITVQAERDSFVNAAFLGHLVVQKCRCHDLVGILGSEVEAAGVGVVHIHEEFVG